MNNNRMGPWEWFGVMVKLIAFAALVSYAVEDNVTGIDVFMMLMLFHVLSRQY